MKRHPLNRRPLRYSGLTRKRSALAVGRAAWEWADKTTRCNVVWWVKSVARGKSTPLRPPHPDPLPRGRGRGGRIPLTPSLSPEDGGEGAGKAHRFISLSLLAVCALLLGLFTPPVRVAWGYNVSPYFLGEETVYSKWGDPHAGMPSGVITWSLMADGATVSPALPDVVRNSVHGTSNVGAAFAQVGGEAAALALIQEAMEGWSSVANLQFVYVGVDDGTPFGAPIEVGQRVGDIRIGGFSIDGFSAAVGYVPFPPALSTQGGDILFNIRPDISLYSAPEAEGELYDLFPPGGGFYRNEFRGLFAHELGHALGLLHSNVPDGLMCGFVDGTFDGSLCAYLDPDQDGRAPVNRLPDADDVAGIQFLYGAPAISETGDFNSDGTVDGHDFLVWQRGHGIEAPGTGTAPARTQGNADGDLDVDGADLSVWEAEFGDSGLATSQSPGVRPLPEPASFPLLVLASLSIACLAERRLQPWQRLGPSVE